MERKAPSAGVTRALIGPAGPWGPPGTQLTGEDRAQLPCRGKEVGPAMGRESRTFSS